MKKFGNVLWGLVIILIGLIIGLNAMGITNINVFFRGWWTLFIIIPSFIGMFKSDNKMWSFIWTVVGIVLLLCAQDILSFEWVGKLIFPFVLIMIGIGIIFKDVVSTKINDKVKELNSNKDNLEEYCATFASQESNFAGKEFNGANIDAVFGSVELDLENATLTKDQIINCNAIFGGIEIKAPKNVNVKVKSTPIFGGVTNKVNTPYQDNLPTLYINAFVMFGGVDIK